MMVPTLRRRGTRVIDTLSGASLRHLGGFIRVFHRIERAKSNQGTFADNLKHLRLTKVAVDTDLSVQQVKFEDKLFRFAEPTFSSKEKQGGEARFHDYRLGIEYPTSDKRSNAA